MRPTPPDHASGHPDPAVGPVLVPVVIVMGPAGAGKTTVGRALAAASGRAFHDADDHHPPANVARMRAGLPLDAAARAPWLAALAALVHRSATGAAPPMVLACSALTRDARRRLAAADGPAAPGGVAFVHLAASRALLAERLAARPGHFFPPALLDSQLATLEPPAPDADEPAPVLVLDAAEPVATLVARARAAFG